MRPGRSLQIVGILSFGFSLSMLPPALVAAWYDDGHVVHFTLAFIIVLGFSAALWLPLRGQRGELHRRDGFVVVTLFWVLLGLLGALPFLFVSHLSPIDALFEAVSGLTTTGATVLTGIDSMPPSILYYRQQLQWLGGMGLVVLAVAILPLLGIGGMQLYRAETPGPMKDEKMTPRLAHSARALWIIYLWLTVACAFFYWLAGMNLFDAIGHSFATISTGGFSTHDASIGYFNSGWVDTVAIVFMLLGAINFSIHFVVWRERSLSHYFKDIEVRTFLLFVLSAVIVFVVILRVLGFYDSLPAAFDNATFEIVSIITSTGFGVADFVKWPLFLPTLLIFIGFVGGCGGSTAGGMKVMRVILLIKEGIREVKIMQHPRSLRPIKIGNRVLSDGAVQAIVGFFSVYILAFVVILLLMMAVGLDQVSAFSAVATCINNVGPGLGDVAYTFSTVSDPIKLLAVIAMLLGRLEVFTLLVLLTPAFWRQ